MKVIYMPIITPALLSLMVMVLAVSRVSASDGKSYTAFEVETFATRISPGTTSVAVLGGQTQKVCRRDMGTSITWRNQKLEITLSGKQMLLSATEVKKAINGNVFVIDNGTFLGEIFSNIHTGVITLVIYRSQGMFVEKIIRFDDTMTNSQTNSPQPANGNSTPSGKVGSPHLGRPPH